MKRSYSAGGEAVEAEPRLLAPRVLGEHADALAEVGMGADQREPSLARGRVHRGPQRGVELVGAGEAAGRHALSATHGECS